MICAGAFTRQGNHGNLLGRTLLLYRDYGARVITPLRATPLALAEEALGLPLPEALAIAFGYYASTMQRTAIRIDPALPPPPLVASASSGAVDIFLERFAGTLVQLTANAERIRGDWQNLHLQDRPLLRRGDRTIVLDEAFLLERVTTGLFFLILEQEGWRGGEAAQEQWRKAYGKMHELLVEDYLRAFAPPGLGGARTMFDEKDLERAYDPNNTGGGRADIVIDFGSTVLLAEAVSGQLSVETRINADPHAFADDISRLVMKKARQLAGTVEKVTRDPQPPGAPLAMPATSIDVVVVPGGQFPVNPVTTRYINSRLRADPVTAALTDDPRVHPLAVLDLRDLEHAESIRTHDHCTLPELLQGWRSDPNYAEVSLSDWLVATEDQQAGSLQRPALLAQPLEEAFAAIKALLNPLDEPPPASTTT